MTAQEGLLNPSQDGLEWQRGSRCANGACVEVAQLGNIIMVRNSSEPGIVLRIPVGEWQEFVSGVRASRFDVE